MGKYVVRRLMTAIPTILVISFIIFAIVDLPPSDPTSNLPMPIPPEVRAKVREAPGAADPFVVKYVKWLNQFFIAEPLNFIETVFDVTFPGSEERARVISWATRGPVIDIIAQRLPQTLWVVGSSYILGVLIAIPVGIYSAYRQYSIFDQVGTFLMMVGFSVPTFFTGLMFIIVFSVNLKWFPSVYDTTHVVTDIASLKKQLAQMIMPVTVLTLYTTAQMSRYTRASTLENLQQDFIRTARSKGLTERVVVGRHVVRNSLIPVVTLIALGIPGIFAGALITEQIFRINGIGQYLIIAIQGGDLPTVQTVTFIFAVLVVLFNIVADVLYGILDPRVTYT
ncbi:MAG: ABC transporter permease [Chloroflexi bacterium]|nr:ABC transporter permease [Chloroflexota bacterium]